MKSQKLSADEARELFNYDPETGLLSWRTQRGRAGAGAAAGTLRKDGYLAVQVNHQVYLVHRVVWLVHHGVWPTDLVDHINGLRRDNRIENIREASRSLNRENQREARRDSSTGLLGAYLRGGRFEARITVRGRSTGLGGFPTAEAAHQAYLTAKRELHAGCTL